MTVISVERDRFGNLSARNDFPMKAKPGLTLRLTTRKDIRGNLTTSAMCGIMGEHSFSVSFALAGDGGDFTKDVLRVGGKRATAKAIEAQHGIVLGMMPALLEEAEAHYTKQPA